MSKFEITMSTSYVPDWGLTEAIRELVQNAIDNADGDDDKYQIYYDSMIQELRIGSFGGTLTTNTLLIGNTTKATDSSKLGQYGEGYKVATMVLLRLGYSVTFHNYSLSEIWTTRLCKSRKFDATVPVFETSKAKLDGNGLSIVISKITRDQIQELCTRNLAMDKCLNNHMPKQYTTRYGSVLLDPEYAGQIFVGGLYVCDDSNLSYGFDFKPDVVRLDRDRRLVNNFDLQTSCAKILSELLKTNDADAVDFVKSITDKYEAEYVTWYTSTSTSRIIAEDALNKVKATHGNDAVPVSDTIEFNKLKDAGKNAVMVPSQTLGIIRADNDIAKQLDTVYDEVAASSDSLSDRMTAYLNMHTAEIAYDARVALRAFVTEVKDLEDRLQELEEDM